MNSSNFMNNKPIPPEYAFCAPDPKSRITLSKNLNPGLAWQDLPPNARSLALICHDPDVPSKGDDVNQEGRSVPASLPRVDFFHWVLVDLPTSVTAVAEGDQGAARRSSGADWPALATATRAAVPGGTRPR